jgi:hypothetical protein
MVRQNTGSHNVKDVCKVVLKIQIVWDMMLVVCAVASVLKTP